MKKSAAERMWARVAEGTTVECWTWPGAKNPKGYGHVGDGRGVTLYVHRVAYESRIGPIPEGSVVDHRCRNASCVNPRHLRAITQHMNVVSSPYGNSAKTHCDSGHEYDEKNTRINKHGHRECRACDREKHRRQREARARAS